MPALLELLKQLPDILRAASADQLALAAFLFLLGVGAVVFLMKDASASWKFASIALWLVATLVVFVVVVGPPGPSNDFAYLARLVGSDAGVQGRAFRLDLDGVAAGVAIAHSISFSSNGPPAKFRIESIDPDLSAKWEGDVDEVTLSKQNFARLDLSVTASTLSDRQVRRIVLTPTSSSRLPPLTLSVSYQVLQPSLTLEVSSGPKASGRGQDFSSIYSVCTTPPPAGHYVVESSQEWLTGDRSCGAWSTCTPRRTPDGRSACLDFTLQGHNECLGPFQNCDAIRASEGHVRATYRLERASPRLTQNAG